MIEIIDERTHNCGIESSRSRIVGKEQSEKTGENERCQDVVWLVLYVVNISGFIGFSVYSLTFFSTYPLFTGNSVYLWSTFGIGVGGALVFSFLVILLFKKNPKASIWISLFLMIAVNGTYFVLLYVLKTIKEFGLVLLLVFLLLMAMMVFSVFKKYEKITIFLLKRSSKIVFRVKSLFILVLVANLVNIGLELLYIFGISFILNRNTDTNLVYFYLFLYSINAYWSVSTIHYLTLAVTAQVVKVFLNNDPSLKSRNLFPSLKRVCCHSLGSIALAALVVTFFTIFIEVVKQILYQSGEIMFCLCVGCLNFLEYYLKMFSEYTIVKIGLSSESFFEMARATAEMFVSNFSALYGYVITNVIINTYVVTGFMLCLLASFVVDKFSDLKTYPQCGLISGMVYFTFLSRRFPHRPAVDLLGLKD